MEKKDRTHDYYVVSHDFNIRSSKMLKSYDPRQACAVEHIARVSKAMDC